MATRGRKPKPTKLKITCGNPGKRPLNDSEPQYPPGAGDAPEHLDADAKAEWVRVSALLTASGVLTQVDRAVLAMYCAAWSRWVRVEKIIAATSELLTSKEGGLYQNPYLSVANHAAKQMKELAPLLGLDPSSRSRLIVEKTEAANEAHVRPRIFKSEAEMFGKKA